MRAKAKLILMATILSSTAAHAQQANISCEQIADTGYDYFLSKMKTFSTDIYGKPAIAWSKDDLIAFSQNIAQCNGLPKVSQSGKRVSYNSWINPLNAAAQQVLPINERNAAVKEAYKSYWNWGVVPECQTFMSWKRDKVWYTDNSKELFGKDLREMTHEEGAILKGFVKECVPVATGILELNRMAPKMAEQIGDDIARAVDREYAAAKEEKEEIAPSLRIYHEGRRIPFAYLGNQSRKWVDFVNRFELQDRSMRVEDLITVSQWTQMILENPKEGPEFEFATVIRDIVTKRSFSQQ